MSLDKMKTKDLQLVKNSLTNGLGLFVTIFNQIILLPLYLHFWSVEMYGDWIVLSALSQFFAASDLGFTTIFTNDFTISYAKKDYKRCSQLLSSNYAFLVLILLPVVLLCFILVYSVDVVSTLGLSFLTLFESRVVLVLLVLHVFATMIGKVPNAIYRANSKAHIAFLIDNVTWFLESLIIGLCLILNISLIWLSVLYIVPRIITFVLKIVQTNRLFRYEFRMSDVSKEYIIKAIKPSFSIASFPLSNTLILQGLSLIVNKNFGALELVLFNTTRTLANMVKFCSNIVTNSFYPEFAIEYGNQNSARLFQISRYCIYTAVIISVLSFLILLPFGNLIYDIWTNGCVVFSFPLLLSFLCVISIDNYWNARIAPLVSINEHKNLGFIAIILSIISLVISYCVAIWLHNMYLVVCCLLLMHIIMVIYVEKEIKRFKLTINKRL